jgi:hypothetical protein
MRSCGVWIDERSHGDSKSALDSSVSQTWLMGFLSGIAVGLGEDFLKDAPDGASLYLWMDNYCRAHPLNSIGDGGMDLALELVAKKKGKK